MPRLFGFSQLSPMALRLISIRLLCYLGIQSTYFIGIMGNLTFEMGGGVIENVLGIGLVNLMVIAGSLIGGPIIDRLGPRPYLLCTVLSLMGCSVLLQTLSGSILGTIIAAPFLGVAMGLSYHIMQVLPAWLTNDPSELRTINAAGGAVTSFALIIGPIIGGLIAKYLSVRAVPFFLTVCCALALIPALSFREKRHPHHEAGENTNALAGFGTIVHTPALLLLMTATFVSFFGYGAFDAVESLYYRDVLTVGVEWMGWLSSVSGVGGLIGAFIVTRLPERALTMRSLLVMLSAEGLACLVYVGTSSPYIAMIGQMLIGVAFGVSIPVHATLVQLHAPLSVLGRVNAFMGMATNAAGLAPLVTAPLISQLLGVQGTLVAASLCVLLFPQVLGFVYRRLITRLVDEELKLHPKICK